jgi:hypothetical protein
VSVTDFEGLVDAIAYFARCGLPCAITQLTIIESRVSEEKLIECCYGTLDTYGILWPVLRVTVFPDDMML